MNVMLRAVFSRGQGFNIKVLPASPLVVIPTTQRFLSTSSAIRRGLRKSRPKTQNAESGSRYGGTRNTTYSEGQRLSTVDRRHALPRERRPNHQQGLDVEDMRGPERFNQMRTKGPNFPGRFGRRDGSSSSFSKPDREAGGYRDTRNSSQDRHGSSWDKRSSFTTPFKTKDYAPKDGLRASRHYESRSFPASEPSRRREDAFREQLRTTERHEYKVSRSLAPTRERGDQFQAPGGFESRRSSTFRPPTREREETSGDQFQAPRGFESRRPSSFARPIRKPPNRAERRFMIYGHGDTAPGGISRSELDVEENGNILKPASKQLRMAAKRRQLGDFSEPGLADEHDYVSDKPPRRLRPGERDSSSRIHEDPWRVKEDIPLSIPYTTPASEFLYGTSVIFAALTAMRRKMYKLYVYSGENREAGVIQNSIQDLARDRKVEVIKVDGDWLRMMDKLSTGRPHNVCQPASFPYQFAQR